MCISDHELFLIRDRECIVLNASKDVREEKIRKFVTDIKKPYGAVTLNSELYICDYDNHVVKVYSFTGNLIRTFGQGDVRDNLFQPYRICHYDGEIFVYNYKSSIKVFSTAGVYQRMFYIGLGTNTLFSTDHGLIMDHQGIPYLRDKNGKITDSTIRGYPSIIGCAGDNLMYFADERNIYVCLEGNVLDVLDTHSFRSRKGMCVYGERIFILTDDGLKMIEYDRLYGPDGPFVKAVQQRPEWVEHNLKVEFGPDSDFVKETSQKEVWKRHDGIAKK